MNVLILTPDRVGSTLLQRLLTIYMLRRGFDRPVINLHELSNGLGKYYNQELGQEIVGKHPGMTWGYFQSLSEVVDLLKSADHYVTSRLAYYHLERRNDGSGEQLKFYEYLNDNFYVISCRRSNVFEHALSWIIQSHSKKLNVFNVNEKISAFSDIYKNGIVASQPALIKYLDQYARYVRWTETHFNVQSYFNYETDVQNIEQYILNLEFMQGHDKLSWQDMFGQDFETWNTCHRMLPNLILNSQVTPEHTHRLFYSKNLITQKKWDEVRGPDWPSVPDNIDTSQLPVDIQQEIESKLEMLSVPATAEQYQFLTKNIAQYRNTCEEIQRLQELGIMITGVPIKLQSLKEKQHVIKNFDQCVDWYNQWASGNGYDAIYTNQQLDQVALQEEQILNRLLVQQLDNVPNKMLGSH